MLPVHPDLSIKRAEFLPIVRIKMNIITLLISLTPSLTSLSALEEGPYSIDQWEPWGRRRFTTDFRRRGRYFPRRRFTSRKYGGHRGFLVVEQQPGLQQGGEGQQLTTQQQQEEYQRQLELLNREQAGVQAGGTGLTEPLAGTQ